MYVSSHLLSSGCLTPCSPPFSSSLTQVCCDVLSACSCDVQSALRDAAKQDDKQGVFAIAKKANDLYKQQQEIQKRADQR